MNPTNLLRSLRQLCREDRGGEVLEYSLILGTIVIAVVVAVATYGNRVLARWTTLSSSV